MNKLYYGDCLTVMKEYMESGSVDLIYLDPPFNSNREYNAIYKDETGRPLPDQIEAFRDLWALDEERERVIRQMPLLMRKAGIDDGVAEFWKSWASALRATQPRLLAYLSYMVERLLPMRGILKPSGSIYLHCDPTASHYIKVMMDVIFGHENFRNEIIWCYTQGGRPKKDFPRKHDTILRYSKTKNYAFNSGAIKTPYELFSGKSADSFTKSDGDGRAYKEVFGSDRKKKYRYYKDEGKIPYDWWVDVYKITGRASSSDKSESMGYATQKPLALLERIIKASSNEGDVVFDPFCGCATTLEAAHHLDRKWIGIDIAIHAIKRVARVRLKDRLGLKEGVDFEIRGIPHSVEGAKDLWNRDKYHFQKWAIEQIDGFVTSRKTADRGIDGRLYFSLTDQKDLQSMVLEVKGGKNIDISVLRDLRGVLERDNALMAGLIIMDKLGARKSANFESEMACAGDLNENGVSYPRMQMLTIQEILKGKRFNTPSVARGKTVSEPVIPHNY